MSWKETFQNPVLQSHVEIWCILGLGEGKIVSLDIALKPLIKKVASIISSRNMLLTSEH